MSDQPNSTGPKNVWAVGRNYSDHAKELGHTEPLSEPMIFLKAGSTIVTPGPVKLPQFSKNVHHEIEIALRFGPARDAHGFFTFDAFAVALDLTARDKQNELKAKGHPWTLAKSFRESCPLSPFTPFSGPPPKIEFNLKVNGELRQSGQSSDMIFPYELLRTFVQKHFPVEPGDVLLTGTPSGVAALKAGDVAVASLKSETGDLLEATWSFT